ncbi:hypothetical protein E1B28_009437 [Marasmius oreades]|uniref:Uncharacterized protein n=1 Tax=Marasmius oreades TaxID=181124 RepID=A0A9P7UVB3_9AGAR|nr:uncharacterized protein E1B28_009437 [Marasmius oreades]KAG7093154.1 hypothetical protein E1B28_009437 [Marasmius oreades]
MMGSRNHSNYGSPDMNVNSQYGPQPGQPQQPAFHPRYMTMLAAEMKMYTGEVMRFQDEIRRLKFEIDELKAWKEREIVGLPTAWLPPSLQPALPAPPEVDAAEQPPEDYEPTRPAWRTVHKKPARKPKQKAIGAASPPPSTSPAPAASPPPLAMPGGFETSGWAQWRPHPAYSPAPMSTTPTSPFYGGRSGPKPGLFGPEDE